MKDLDKNIENNIRNVREAKKFSLEFKVNALQQLILQRFHALTILSSIGFGVSGIVISIRDDLIQNQLIASTSAALFILIALVSFGRHLYLIRSDIKAISRKIENLSQEDWNRSLQKKEFKADWWPETLFGLLIISIMLFGLSFFCI